MLEARGLMEFFLPEAIEIMVDGVGTGAEVGFWLLIWCQWPSASRP